MKLAILSTDSDVLALLAAAVGGGHQVVWLSGVRAEDADAVGQLLPGLAVSEDWELLLDHATADAVIVGRGTAGDDLKEEQLKRLTADSIPLLVVHPATTSMLLTYELDMTRRAEGGILRHYNPLIDANATAELARYVLEGSDALGPVQQITCERQLEEYSRDAVVSHLARDAELLEAVSGGIHKVSGVGPCDVDQSYISLKAQMITAGDASMSWAAVPAAGREPGMRLTLVSQRGTMSAWYPEQMAPGESWQVDTTLQDQHSTEPRWQFDAPTTAIAELAAAIEESREMPTADVSTWDTATRSMEVVDAIELSLQKGRTIEVHYQQLTERLAFRGTMAVFGLGLLLFGMAVMFIAGVAGDVLRVPGMRYWPLGLLVMLALFLLLQGVPLLIAKPSDSPATDKRDRR